MNEMIEQLNSAGASFVGFTLPMLIQSSLLIAVVLGLDLILRKRVRAVVRYCLWMLVLVKLMLPATLSAPTGIGYWIGGNFLNPPGESSPPAGATIVEIPPAREPPENFAPPQLAPTLEFAAMPPAPTDVAPAGDISEKQPTAASTVTASPPAAPVAAASVAITWEAIVLLGWIVLAGGMVLLLIQRALFVRGLIAQATPAGAGLGDVLDDCRDQLGFKRRIELKFSPNTASPAVCGLLRPVILIPQGLPGKLGPRDLKAVLLHELVHIKRGDLWVNLVQAVLQIAYFYNPLLWAANAIIRRVREQAVDEAVLVAMGDEAEDYPDTLLSVAGLSLSRPALSLRLIGVVESKKALTGRIKHILRRPLPKSARVGIVGLVAILIAAAALLPMAKGENKKPANEQTKAEESVKSEDKTPKTYTATLSSGATVELLGISNLHSKDKQWWRPDGTEIELAEKYTYSVLPQPMEMQFDYELLINVKGSEWSSIKVKSGSAFSGRTFRNGQQIEVVYHCRKSFQDSQQVESFKIEVASGPWEMTRSVTPRKERLTGRPGSKRPSLVFRPMLTFEKGAEDIAFSTPYEREDQTIIDVAHTFLDHDVRLVAVDHDGKIHKSSHGHFSKGRVFDTATWNFLMPLKEIKKFRFETRPYEWVEFKNVSLKPGHKTDVQVIVPANKKARPKARRSKLRNAYIPDADTKNTSIVLDLVSGEMIEPPPGEGREILNYFTKLGRGDLAFDRGLIVLRGGEISKIVDGGTKHLVSRERDDSRAYKLPELPAKLRVTTGSGKRLDVTVLSATDDGGINIEYERTSPSVPHPAEGKILIVASVLKVGLAEDAAIVKALGERCQVDLTGSDAQAVVIDRNPADVLELLKEQKTKLLSRPKLLANDDQSSRIQISHMVPFLQLPETGGEGKEEVVYADVGVFMTLRAHSERGTVLNVELISSELVEAKKLGVSKLACVRHVPVGAGLLLRISTPEAYYRVTGFTRTDGGAVELTKQRINTTPEPKEYLYVWLKPVAQAGKGRTRQRHFVKLVVGKARMTFQSQETTWGDLPKLLEAVPNRSHTVLELAMASDNATLKQKNDATGRVMTLARRFGFEYSSYTGIHPLGAKGTPSQSLPATKPTSGTFDLHVADADAEQVLRQLAKQSGRSIVLLPVKKPATVSVDLYAATFPQALDAVIRAAGYTLIERDGIIYVGEVEAIKKLSAKLPAAKEGIVVNPKEAGRLFKAISAGDVKRVKKILANNPALVHAISASGYTPLQALTKRDRPVTNLFGIKTTGRATDKFRSDKIRIAQLLLNKRADIEARGKHGDETPLHFAIRHGIHTNWAGMVAFLLEKGADPNARDNIGRSPLHLAVAPLGSRDMKNRLVIVRALLENGADPFAEDTRDALRPVEYAKQWPAQQGVPMQEIVDLFDKSMAPKLATQTKIFQDIVGKFANAVKNTDDKVLAEVTVDPPDFRTGIWKSWAKSLRQKYAEDFERLGEVIDSDWRHGWACIFVRGPKNATDPYLALIMMRFPDGKWKIITKRTISKKRTNPTPASYAIGQALFYKPYRDAVFESTTQLGGSKLEFRIAPPPSAMDEAELASYRNWLKAGRIGFWWKGGRIAMIAGRMPDHAWLPIADERTNFPALVTSEYKGKKYVLVSDRPGETMVQGEGKNAWGLARVYATKDMYDRPSVGFEFDDRGAEVFAAFTKGNVNNTLAIVVDDKVISAPKLMAPLYREGKILGRFSKQEVKALVKALKVGMPPNPEEASTPPAAQAGMKEVAEKWLGLVDEGRYAEGWNQAAAYFKTGVTKQKWIASIKPIRAPLGAVKSRKSLSTRFVTISLGVGVTTPLGSVRPKSLRNILPNHRYVVIQYQTSFENKPEAAETIKLMKDKDGKWRGSGYNVLKKAPPATQAEKLTTSDTAKNSKQKAFTDAIVNGDLQKIRQLLADDPSLISSQRGKNWRPALNLAVRHGHAEIAKLLLAKGASPNEMSTFGMSPLHEAANRGYAGLVKLLVTYGTDINGAENGRQHTPLYYARTAQVAEALIANGGDVNWRDKRRATPLHFIARSGMTTAAEVLLAHGADINATDNSGRTPLHMGAVRKEMVEFLIAKGADINAKDKAGATPLRNAIKAKEKKAAELLLLHGADCGDFTIYEVVWLGDIARVRKLLKSNPALANDASKTYREPVLFTAIRKGHIAIAKFLLDNGAKLNVKGKYKEPPLHAAAYSGHKDVIALLLRKGADVNRKGAHGEQALHWAAAKGHGEITRLLVEAGAEVNTHTDTPRADVDTLPSGDDADVIREQLRFLALCKKQKQAEAAGSSLQIMGGVRLAFAAGDTPLHSAAQWGHKDIVKMLLANGAEVNVTNKWGQTPLHYASVFGHEEVIRTLLNAGADPEAKMPDGTTPQDLIQPAARPGI